MEFAQLACLLLLGQFFSKWEIKNSFPANLSVSGAKESICKVGCSFQGYQVKWWRETLDSLLLCFALMELKALPRERGSIPAAQETTFHRILHKLKYCDQADGSSPWRASADGWKKYPMCKENTGSLVQIHPLPHSLACLAASTALNGSQVLAGSVVRGGQWL